jgi:hypothetical protein
MEKRREDAAVSGVRCQGEFQKLGKASKKPGRPGQSNNPT